MQTILAIAGAGAVGSVSRYLLGVYVQRSTHLAFPIGTLVVNVLGSLLIGLLAGHFMNDESLPVLKSALMVGFCGGFTTFSAFSLETFGLLAGGEYAKAAGYVLASVALCLLATGAGFAISRP
jgi:fluoride exporter